MSVPLIVRLLVLRDAVDVWPVIIADVARNAFVIVDPVACKNVV